MMWGVTLILVSCVAAKVASHEVKMECREFYDFPPDKSTSPSFLAELNVELLPVGENYNLNVSWAINIDASIEYLTGTRIVINGEPPYVCEYNPPLAEADFTGLKQIWFHHLVSASYGFKNIQVANLPLPPLNSGLAYKYVTIKIPSSKPRVTPTTTQVPIVDSTTLGSTPQESTSVPKDDLYPGTVTSIMMAIFGGLASLMILSFCYIIYKRCGSNCATSVGFKMLPASPTVPVPVLVVYPAENAAFQQAVVALAEFLQWHGGCSVAVDMWQQRKIAELGPMRWLAEQAKAADRVLIVCPQVVTPSSQPGDFTPNHMLPEPSIPAAAHDLYPLILNMVASHAKSAGDLAKFWVVQLGDKKPSNLALELRACKTFCLMKDLIKLCRSLHSQRQGHKTISNLTVKPGIEKNSVKLREALEKLGRHQPSIFRDLEPLKSVVTTI